jgi:uncharacterized protein YbjT (DUF2867 family)
MKTATIIGSTGLIGGHILELLRKDQHFSHIRLLVRRTIKINDPKVEIVVIDFNNAEQYKAGIAGSNAVFCAIGTTQKKVGGDKDAYRKVDFDIPVNAARFCAATGCEQFLLVSSVGADSKGSNFYIKLKGEVEDEVKNAKVNTTHIFRPSMLLGHRENEFRLAERIIQPIMSTLNFLIPTKWKAVKATDVAKAMVAAAKNNHPGFHIHEYREIMKLANTVE